MPRIRITVGVATFLGAERRGLLLRPAHEQHPLGAEELGQVLVGHVAFVAPVGLLHEVDPGHRVVTGETVRRGVEGIGDPGQRRGEAIGNLNCRCTYPTSLGVLQARHVDVAVHPVDTVHLHDHVLGQDRRRIALRS